MYVSFVSVCFFPFLFLFFCLYRFIVLCPFAFRLSMFIPPHSITTFYASRSNAGTRVDSAGLLGTSGGPLCIPSARRDTAAKYEST